jgi:hypothetical protein
LQEKKGVTYCELAVIVHNAIIEIHHRSLILIISGEAAGLEVGVVEEPGEDAGGGPVLGESNWDEEKDGQSCEEVGDLHLVDVEWCLAV